MVIGIALIMSLMRITDTQDRNRDIGVENGDRAETSQRLLCLLVESEPTLTLPPECKVLLYGR
jgi:hypothetical protein